MTTRTHHRTAGALLILLLYSLCATAQWPQLPRTRTPPASVKVETKTGDISGKVVNESGQPLANADVYVRPATRPNSPVANTTTNRDGVFSFTGLERGSYTVNASMAAYIPQPAESGSSVHSAAESVTLVLIKGGVVTGTVTDLKGEPVVAIGVRVETVSDESGRKAPAISFENITDDRGIYRVYGMPSGTYVVAAVGDINYSPSGVNAFATNAPTYAPSSSRDAADEIRVRVGEETSNVDIRYRGERGSTISGIVSGTQTRDRGFSVTLTSLAETGPRWNTFFQATNGEFAFEGIPDGDYHLVASAYWNDHDRGLSESIVLNIRGADIEGIELTAAQLASISGAVVLKELKEPVAGCTGQRQPRLSETTVTAWHRVTQGAQKRPQFVWRAGGPETPDLQGNLTLRGLAANEYYFGVRFSSEQWYLQSITFAPSTPKGKPIDAANSWTTIKPGDQLSGLTFTLAQGGALVRGQITLAEEQTLPDKLSVYLVPADAAHADDALRYFVAPVNNEGFFWLHNVAPGRYWMLVQPGTEDTRNELGKIRLPDAAETRASLRREAEERETEVELKPCQDLTFKLPL